MITERHYTQFNEHPEDRIFRDKEYVKRLQKHIDGVYDLLANDLRLNDKGKDFLFDYIFNEDGDIEFEEFLEKYGLTYDEVVIRGCRKCR